VDKILVFLTLLCGLVRSLQCPPIWSTLTVERRVSSDLDRRRIHSTWAEKALDAIVKRRRAAFA
jgi:hypothetical protein